MAGKWSFHKFIICDSTVLREAIAKYINNITNSGTVKDSKEEKTCPKVVHHFMPTFFFSLCIILRKSIYSVSASMYLLFLLNKKIGFLLRRSTLKDKGLKSTEKHVSLSLWCWVYNYCLFLSNLEAVVGK